MRFFSAWNDGMMSCLLLFGGVLYIRMIHHSVHSKMYYFVWGIIYIEQLRNENLLFFIALCVNMACSLALTVGSIACTLAKMEL